MSQEESRAVGAEDENIIRNRPRRAIATVSRESRAFFGTSAEMALTLLIYSPYEITNMLMGLRVRGDEGGRTLSQDLA